jgi:hypothetical protein
MGKVTALFRSRRFWIALAGVASVSANPLGLDAATLEATTLLLGAWVVGDSLSKTV